MRNFFEYYLEIKNKQTGDAVIETNSKNNIKKLAKMTKNLFSINVKDYSYYIITTIKGERERIYDKTEIGIYYNSDGTISIYDSAGKFLINA